MVRVCQKEMPKGSYPGQKDDGFPIEDNLKFNLDVLAKNIADDWDFTIIITGSGEVRVGKSMLAMQVGAYLASAVKKLHGKDTIFTLKDNYAFTGTALMKNGHELAKGNHRYSPLVYDEAGADLESKKVMLRSTKMLLDYFRECGQYNLFNILVLPDFFELPKSLAVTRSICLIDAVYYGDKNLIFQRGYFKFYSRKQKKELYIKGKKFLNYNAAKPDFQGRFEKVWPLNETEYRQLKLDAIRVRSFEGQSLSERLVAQRNGAILALRQLTGLSLQDIGKVVGDNSGFTMPIPTVQDAIRYAEQRNPHKQEEELQNAP